MNAKHSQWMARSLALVAILCVFSLWLRFSYFSPDPDRLYQLAISREVALRGAVLPNIPQAEDIGWQEYFPDKEFGYHVLTGLGFGVGQSEGALAVSAGIGAALLLLCFWTASRRASTASALLFTSIFLLTPQFLWRLGNLKPLEIGVFCFLLLTAGLLRNSPLLASLGAALFPLSYHLIPMPLALILCYGWFNRRAPEARRTAAISVLALGAGILLNPYFPGNLSFVHQSAWTVKNVLAGKEFDFGAELLQYDATSWLFFFSLPAVFTGYALTRKKALPSFLATFTLFLWALSVISPRAQEYALPLSVLCCAFAIPKLEGTAGKVILWSGSTLLLLQFAFYFVHEPRDPIYRFLAQRHQETIDAVLRIPATARGQKVFHCGWEMGPYIFYLRPDMRFVDLLDPAFLYLHDPGKWEAKQRIRKGERPEDLAKTVFRADYYLCENSLPGKEPLYEGRTGIRLYKLR